MVLVHGEDLKEFEIDPAWLPMLHNPLPLPIPNRAAAEELLKYARVVEKEEKWFKKTKETARLDAYATGMVATRIARRERPRHLADGRIHGIDAAIEDEFISSYNDPALLQSIARGARMLNYPYLHEAIYVKEMDRLVESGAYSIDEAMNLLDHTT